MIKFDVGGGGGAVKAGYFTGLCVRNCSVSSVTLPAAGKKCIYHAVVYDVAACRLWLINSR